LGAEKGRGAYLIQHHEIWSGRPARVDETWRLPLRKIVIARWLETRAHAMELEDVCRVPNGLDTATFRVTQPIVGRHPRVAMLYSGWAWKGADDGIAALVIAKSSFPELEAVLFGTHPRPADLPGWIDYLRDPPQERLVRDVYNGSSIYCCPSHAEGWHLPPAEAMGCGCAVVSTDIDGVGDYAEDGRTALMSPARDAEALAANLLRLLRDDTMRVRLAMAGHENIQRFQWEQSTRELERALFADANVSAGT
jgi:glycosyltransferase involved in cell wall biosynthesis